MSGMAKSLINNSVVLRHLDLRNMAVYEAFSENEAERKEFEKLLSYILPLWFSGTYNAEDQIALMIAFNKHVNSDWWELTGHPELQAKVLAAVGLGHVVKHDFHYREHQRRRSPLTDFLIRKYPDIRKDEVGLWCSINSETVLAELCSTWGIQDTDKKEILEEYRSRVI